ncbi:hypothetical protein ANANG_G00174320, partial [Anguilla anguilla]
ASSNILHCKTCLHRFDCSNKEYQKVRVCVPVSQQDKQAIPALRRGRAGPIPLPAKSHQLKHSVELKSLYAQIMTHNRENHTPSRSQRGK